MALGAHPHRSRQGRALRTAIMVALVASLPTVPTVPATAGHPVVTEVEALAYNYYSDVSLFGGDPMRRGYLQDEFAAERGQAAPPETAASPSVECPEGGGSASLTDPDGAKAATVPR